MPWKVKFALWPLCQSLTKFTLRSDVVVVADSYGERTIDSGRLRHNDGCGQGSMRGVRTGQWMKSLVQDKLPAESAHLARRLRTDSPGTVLNENHSPAVAEDGVARP